MTDDDKALVARLRADWPEILVEKHWMMDSDAIEEQRKEAADVIEAQAAEIERLLDYDEAKANALHNTLNQLANAEQEIERIKDRLGWICAVMDLDDEVTLQWIYTELQALRGAE